MSKLCLKLNEGGRIVAAPIVFATCFFSSPNKTVASKRVYQYFLRGNTTKFYCPYYLVCNVYGIVSWDCNRFEFVLHLAAAGLFIKDIALQIEVILRISSSFFTHWFCWLLVILLPMKTLSKKIIWNFNDTQYLSAKSYIFYYINYNNTFISELRIHGNIVCALWLAASCVVMMWGNVLELLLPWLKTLPVIMTGS